MKNLEQEAKSYNSCYYGVITTPFYTHGGDIEYDPRDGRENHLCANPIKVKEAIEIGKNPDITGLTNPTGVPKLIYAFNLNGFTKEEPEVCKTCPQHLKHPGHMIVQPEFKPVIEALAKMDIKCEKIA